jgi:hypothetical protein
MAAVLTAISDGNYFKHAAAAGGVTEVTARNWMMRGDNLLSALRAANEHVDDEIADWLAIYPERDYRPDSDMWDAPSPGGIARDDWVFILFHVLVERAKAQAVKDSVKVIKEAGPKNWQAAAWWLERTQPRDYGRQQRIEHSGPDGGPIETVTPDALIARIREIQESKQQPT